ncbi:hypothetical protein D3C78_584810 [compost metagenome]
MDYPHGSQRFDQRQLPRVELHELLVAGQQGVELDLLLVALAAQHHPEILDGGAGAAVVEIDEQGAVTPQYVAGVAIPVQGDPGHVQGHGVADMPDQLVEHPEELLGQAARHPLSGRQQLTRLVQHALHVQLDPMVEGVTGPDTVDAAEIAPHPLQLIQVVHLELAATDAMPDGEGVALMLQQGLAGKGDGGGDRDLRLTQASGKLVLLEDLGPAPATGAVELHHVTATILILKLVDPVFIAVELDEAGVDAQAAEIDRIHDEVGIEVGIVETHVIHHEKGALLRPILSEIADQCRP